MADREWTYVAASRSRFATTLFVNASALGLVDVESHRGARVQKRRNDAIEALAKRMARSRAKGTSLDYSEPAEGGEAPQRSDAALVRASRGLAERLISKLRGAREKVR